MKKADSERIRGLWRSEIEKRSDAPPAWMLDRFFGPFFNLFVYGERLGEIDYAHEAFLKLDDDSVLAPHTALWRREIGRALVAPAVTLRFGSTRFEEVEKMFHERRRAFYDSLEAVIERLKDEPDRPWLKYKEAAQEAQVDPKTIKNWIAKGHIDGAGGRVDAESLRRYLRGKTPKTSKR